MNNEFIKIGSQLLLDVSLDDQNIVRAGAPTRFAPKLTRKASPYNPYEEDMVKMSEF